MRRTSTRPRRLPPAHGQTLVDVMISMAIVSVGFAALVSAGVASSQTSTKSYRRYIAKELAHRRLAEITFAEKKADRLPPNRKIAGLTGVFTGNPHPPVPFKPDFDDTGSWTNNPERGIYYGKYNTSDLSYLYTDPKWWGMVDIYGRPCSNDPSRSAKDGYHPSCRYRRFIRYTRSDIAGYKAPLWRIQVAVSLDPWRQCGPSLKYTAASPYCSCDTPRTTPWCVFASAILSR